MRTSHFVLSLIAWLALSFPAIGQSVPLSGNNLSSTITSTNTFQLIQASSNNRNGCTIQNNATSASGDIMWIYTASGVTSCSSGTKGASVQLSPGQTFMCNIASYFVLKDIICITGTSSDAFYANFQ